MQSRILYGSQYNINNMVSRKNYCIFIMASSCTRFYYSQTSGGHILIASIFEECSNKIGCLLNSGCDMLAGSFYLFSKLTTSADGRNSPQIMSSTHSRWCYVFLFRSRSRGRERPRSRSRDRKPRRRSRERHRRSRSRGVDGEWKTGYKQCVA